MKASIGTGEKIDIRTGYALVAVSVLGFSAKSVLVKLAFGYGVDPLTFMLMRMYVGAPLFLFALLWKEGPGALAASGRELGLFALMGLGGLGGAMYLSFTAIFAMDASTATLLVFTYPALTILLLFVWYRRFVFGQMVAVILSFCGLFLVLRVDRGGGPADFLGVLAGFGSALCFALYNIVSERVMRSVSPLRLSSYSVLALTIGFTLFFGYREYPDEPALWGLAALLGVFSGFLSFLAFMHGVRILGAGRTAILNSVGPVFTVLWAFLLLGEVLDGVQLFGGATVVAGILVLRLRRG